MAWGLSGRRNTDGGMAPGGAGGQRNQEGKTKTVSGIFVGLSAVQYLMESPSHHGIFSKMFLTNYYLGAGFAFRDVTKCWILLQSGHRVITQAVHWDHSFWIPRDGGSWRPALRISPEPFP